MSFPLPNGHYFGLNPFDVRCHTGDDNWVDEARIKAWQRKYSLTVDREQPVTGRFDGPTQRAVTKVQRENGLPATAVLDEDTWRAVFEAPTSTLAASHDVAPTEVPPKREDAPEGLSGASYLETDTPEGGRADTVSGAPPGAEKTVPVPPAWFNTVAAVGPINKGPLVRKIRTLLGLQPRDTWSQDVSQKVRGVQKAHGLPVTGWVDTRTAIVLDGLAAKR